MTKLTITAALKQKKDLFLKASDLREKISALAAHMESEKSPLGYENPRNQIKLWLQQHKDIMTEIEKLTVAIQLTNCLTQVPILLNENTVTKSITGWIVRRQKLAEHEQHAWVGLNTRLKPVITPKEKEGKSEVINVVYNFDVKERDVNVSLFRFEPTLIDSTLETVNATTELMTKYPDGTPI